MRKSVWMGGGLGLLVLALVAGSFWLAGNSAPTTAAAPAQTVRGEKFATAGSADTPAQLGTVGAAPAPRSSHASQERRRRLAEVRAEFNALRAKGAQASPEKMRALVDELEALSPPGFDPRYFQALRNMLDASAKVQALSTELQGLAKSTAQKDVARQEAILVELRALGERVQAEARNLQTYASVPLKASAP